MKCRASSLPPPTNGRWSSRAYGLCVSVVGTALFAPPAHAEMSCDEIMMMVDNDYDTSIIVEAIRSTGEVPSSGTIACLEERDAPTPILTLVRELAGETAPPPAASEDESPEKGVSAAPPTRAVDLAPVPEPVDPVVKALRPPAFKGYVAAAVLTGTGGILLGHARWIRGNIQEGAQDGSLTYSEGEAMAQTSNRSLYLGYTGVGLGLATAAGTRVFWTTSVGPGAVSISGRW